MKHAGIPAIFAAACMVGPSLAQDQGLGGDWSFSLRALSLHRSSPENGAIMSSNPGGVTFLTADDFDFGAATGWEATIGYGGLSFGSLELRLMHSKFGAIDSFTTPGSFIGVGFTGPGGTIVDSTYDTEFSSGEINLRHSYGDRFSVLGGLRGLDLSDTLESTLNGNVATGLYEAENALVGAQIGAEFALMDASSPLQLNLTGKYGIYSNRSSAGIREFQGNNFIGGFQSDEVRATSHVAELGLMAGYDLSDNARLTAGYQVLWADNIALGSAAASGSRLNPSLLTGTVFRDDILFRGLSIGFELTF